MVILSGQRAPRKSIDELVRWVCDHPENCADERAMLFGLLHGDPSPVHFPPDERAGRAPDWLIIPFHNWLCERPEPPSLGHTDDIPPYVGQMLGTTILDYFQTGILGNREVAVSGVCPTWEEAERIGRGTSFLGLGWTAIRAGNDYRIAWLCPRDGIGVLWGETAIDSLRAMFEVSE